MASAPTHALVGAAIGIVFTTLLGARPTSPSSDGNNEFLRKVALEADRRLLARLPWYAALAAVAPDLDTLMHAFVRYSHPFGHRGAFHSLGLYSIAAVALAALPVFATRRMAVGACLFLSMTSHSLLDMLTNGGLGIALFWPASSARLFFPWRPIPVSPLRAGSFFSEWGVPVLAAELPFAIPLFLGALGFRSWKKRSAT